MSSRLFWLLLCVAALSSACDDSPAETPSGALTGVASIGPEGGRVGVDVGPLAGVWLQVPLGAVPDAVPFTLAEGQPVESPEVRPIGPAVKLGPAGIRFDTPVTVMLPITTDRGGRTAALRPDGRLQRARHRRLPHHRRRQHHQHRVGCHHSRSRK